MQNQQLPKPNTLWRNLKKGTIYRVWMVASEINSLDLIPYVVYQEDTGSVTPFEIFVVCNSEDARLGNVFNTPVNPSEWMLHWENALSGRPVAWARPLSLWQDKFEQVVS